MNIKHCLMTLAVAAALATSAVAAPAPLNESEVRAMLLAHGYTAVDHVEFANNVWTAKATTAIGNQLDVRVDPVTQGISLNYDGDDNDADVPANGLSKAAITAKLRLEGFSSVQDVELDNGVWTAQVTDADGTAHVLDLDAKDGHLIGQR
jgi:hypothetical protein